MKIGRQIAEKILGHCSKCGSCPIGKITAKRGKINGTALIKIAE